MLRTKEYSTELPKEGSLKGFGEKVSEHVKGRAVLNSDPFTHNTVLAPPITDVDMSRLFARRLTAVLQELDGALIVLLKVDEMFLTSYP